MVQIGSAALNHPEPMCKYATIIVPNCSTVVLRGSEALNHLELMLNYLMVSVPSVPTVVQMW